MEQHNTLAFDKHGIAYIVNPCGFVYHSNVRLEVDEFSQVEVALNVPRPAKIFCGPGSIFDVDDWSMGPLAAAWYHRRESQTPFGVQTFTDIDIVPIPEPDADDNPVVVYFPEVNFMALDSLILPDGYDYVVIPSEDDDNGTNVMLCRAWGPDPA